MRQYHIKVHFNKGYDAVNPENHLFLIHAEVSAQYFVYSMFSLFTLSVMSACIVLRFLEF